MKCCQSAGWGKMLTPNRMRWRASATQGWVPRGVKVVLSSTLSVTTPIPLLRCKSRAGLYQASGPGTMDGEHDKMVRDGLSAKWLDE